MVRLCLFALLAALIGAGPARASDGFGAFIKGLRPVCAHRAADACVDAVNRYLDADRNGRVELREIEGAERAARRAVENQGSALNPLERNITAVALLVLQGAGLAKVFANFDANHDGSLSRAELFADFRIDRRPFAKIVKDPGAVDWKRFAGRFGKLGALITGLLPPARRP